MDLLDWVRRVPRAVFAFEPERGPWHSSVNWGSARAFTMPANQDEVLTFGGLEAVPGPPRVYTVQLWKTPTANVVNSDWRCRLSWGVGSFRQQALLDWAPGAHFSLLANEFRLDAVSWRPSVAAGFSGGGQQWPLGFAIGAGARGGPSLATLTEPTSEPGAGGSVTVNVPTFARSVLVRTWDTVALTGNSNPAAASNARVNFQNSGGQVLATVDANLWASAGEFGVPIPNGANSINIANTGPNTQRFSVVWNLSL